MSKFDDISEVLEGPVGWIVVIGLGAIILYVGIKAIDTEIGNGVDSVSAAIKQDMQKVSCWWNNSCMLTSLVSGGKSNACITQYLACQSMGAAACVAAANASSCPLCGGAC